MPIEVEGIRRRRRCTTSGRCSSLDPSRSLQEEAQHCPWRRRAPLLAVSLLGTTLVVVSMAVDTVLDTAETNTTPPRRPIGIILNHHQVVSYATDAVRIQRTPTPIGTIPSTRVPTGIPTRPYGERERQLCVPSDRNSSLVAGGDPVAAGGGGGGSSLLMRMVVVRPDTCAPGTMCMELAAVSTPSTASTTNTARTTVTITVSTTTTTTTKAIKTTKIRAASCTAAIIPPLTAWVLLPFLMLTSPAAVA
mmetsp:Transcript_18343/g.39990  ORF Transcript_18343/g.39990 Transcript_18343/m.39990 type:complete len:249 (+) Transcript_18343:266-1012(+)